MGTMTQLVLGAMGRLRNPLSAELPAGLALHCVNSSALIVARLWLPQVVACAATPHQLQGDSACR